MSILMMPNNMQKERMRKEDIKQTDIKEDSRTISDSANPDSTSKIIRFHPVDSSSDTSKAAQPNRIDTRPAFDRYIPEKSVEQKSYGHYKLVSDERGNQKIQFSEPAENPTGNSEGIPTAEASGRENADSISKDGLKIQKLKKKRLELKQQILSESDPQKAEQLKNKLALIERKIKSQNSQK